MDSEGRLRVPDKIDIINVEVDMQLIFIGADHEVTGSCHYIQTGGRHILVDYGMEQGANIYENVPLPVPASEIDYVFITHAHIDHSGMLPKLYADGFRGEIICTEATKQLCDIMLRDSAHIQVQEAAYEAKQAGRRGKGSKGIRPIYTMENAMNVIRLIKGCSYGEKIHLCDGIDFRFTDIGHLLGSASIELWLEENGEEKKIVFSGDIGNTNQPLLKNPQPTGSADYVVIESTYGDRLHEEIHSDPVMQLTEILRETLLRGGNLVIPAFAVGRTQVLLYYIHQIKENNLLPECPGFPVYVDSPLAVEATTVFEESKNSYFDEEAVAILRKGSNPLTFPRLYLSITTDESKQINVDPEPKVIISAAGMCDAGRIRHHLKYNISRPESTILFVGYQSEGSLGAHILSGAEEIKLFGESYAVRAQIARMDGMSGHADKNGLTKWLKGFTEKPEQVFVVHGEDLVTTSFAEYLTSEHGYQAMAPFSGTSYDLAAGRFIRITKGVPLGKNQVARSVSDSYTKLKLAQKRLEQVIEESRGLPNKELDKFMREINDLCNKYRIDR